MVDKVGFMSRETLRSCHGCGKVHRLSADQRRRVCCTRCGTNFPPMIDRRIVAERTTAAALGALALYFPAILLPILSVEQLGQRHQSSLLGGSLELLQNGNLFVGTIVILFSILFPLIKIIGLLELSWFGLLMQPQQAAMYRWLELASKWSMLDVMLLALLVMIVKLGGIVEFHLGPAVIAFIGCVGMNMLASYCFDPHAIWENEHE